jgi:hypothetical protein
LTDTDDEDASYTYKRCIAVNGINNVLTEPDALDRSVMLDFTRISDEQRREEAEVDAGFDAMKPTAQGSELCRIRGCHAWTLLTGPGWERKRLYRCGECWLVTNNKARCDRELRETAVQQQPQQQSAKSKNSKSR